MDYSAKQNLSMQSNAIAESYKLSVCLIINISVCLFIELSDELFSTLSYYILDGVVCGVMDGVIGKGGVLSGVVVIEDGMLPKTLSR